MNMFKKLDDNMDNFIRELKSMYKISQLEILKLQNTITDIKKSIN